MKLAKAQKILLSSSLSVFLVGCGAPNYSQSEMHITVEEVESKSPIEPKNIPSLVKSSPTSPVLSNAKGSDTFDVVVTKVPVRDLLFALARDAGVNMDVDDKVGGFVTISALDQTLDAILERISAQVNIRLEKVGDAIVVRPDEPYFNQYNINFLGIVRSFSSTAESSGVGSDEGGGSANISNTNESDFWGRLEESIDTIIGVGFKEGEQAGIVSEEREESDSFVEENEVRIDDKTPAFNLNRETGILIVYAQKRLQDQIQSLLDRTLEVANRQVLLEATIVEVVLNNQYNQGIDWTVFNSLAEEGLGFYQGGLVGAPAAALEFITQSFSDTFDVTATSLDDLNRQVSNIRNGFTQDPNTTLTTFDVTQTAIRDADGNISGYTAEIEAETDRLNQEATRRSSGGLSPSNPLTFGGGAPYFTGTYRKGDISAAVQLLDSFGDAKVLSSPRISALNHQAAVLRVVDQEVYFNFTVDETINPDSGLTSERTYTVEENTVDVGFAMNVLPFITPDGEVILNLKPSVTRVLEYRRAPTPPSFGSGGGSVDNFIPVTRVRELESVISLRDGEVAVLGGLLEDRTGDNNRSIPGLSKLPGVGALFENKNETTFKTEFVVFIRAKIIKNPSLNGDYSDYKHLLPNTDFIIRDTERSLVPPRQEDSR